MHNIINPRWKDTERVKYYINKTILNHLISLKPNKIIGRFYCPKVLVNSIPKAGTHLLESSLERMPMIRNTNLKTIIESWNSLEVQTIEKLLKFKNGQIRTSHLPYYEELHKVTMENEISTIFVIRNPLSIIMSHMKYVTYLDTHHPVHKYFLDLENDDKRLMALIKGVPGIVSGIKEVLEKFSGWLDKDNVTVVRFEDLVGAKGGGSDKAQEHEIIRIMDVLKIKYDSENLDYIKLKTFNEKSLTFRGEKKINIEESFSSTMLDTFYSEVDGVIHKYGYTK